MYIPSFPTIARAVGVSDATGGLPNEGSITVDVKTLKLLLRFVALAADYDEDYYINENPDIAEAHEAGRLPDLRKHFMEHGFFEGRKAATVDFDEEWYLKIYSDVAASVAEGAVLSGRAHFNDRGEIEMRSPNEESQPWVRGWAEALSRPR